ncbi:hypothetical protein BO94DRAFT_507503 [Aspergillus sclerotioniger CBS 115572]|uniref:Zn(2)-C6 fungal-type domain-containing protein n=1 Tax=Aspergillus sclerotioniger CBS 115572 TaxID=1450535 RepID=A0A317XBX4_9EURO|nr:hypothetical protein BO94DRAFT_507503 [Aspergillus sclerotioniger CBS 115572]PWY96043.1 hypothetical protein BO94DRAFT_507503 [Aspergillus sclerotioniger CBS 115572]
MACLALATTQKRQKAFTKRSRTGCRTCRHRRVKCDETPGQCTNCTSTKRQCEGYDTVHVQWSPNDRSGSFRLPQLTTGVSSLTSAERQGILYFQHSTIPTLIGFYDSPLWERLSLQICQEEPAVCHASIALSAVHRGFPLAGSLQEEWYRFAFEQLDRSFRLLINRRASQDPQFTNVVLLCCLMFVALEFMVGEYENAFRHLRGGLHILKQRKGHACTDSMASFDQCLMHVFSSLDIQSTYFGIGNRVLCEEIDDSGSRPNVEDPQSWHFKSIYEARQVLEPITGDVIQYCGLRVTAGCGESLVSRQLEIFARLNRFLESLAQLRYEYAGHLTPKEKRGVTLLELEAVGARTSLQIIPYTSGDPALAQYTDEFECLLSLSEAVLRENTDIPRVSMDIGVIPPLYLVAKRSVDYGMRWRAIRLLQSCPHQEGPWDAALLAQVAIETINIEAMVAAGGEGLVVGRIRQKPPAFGGFVMLSDDRRHVRIPFLVGKVEKHWCFDLDDELSGMLDEPVLGDSAARWHRVIPSHLRFLQ